MSVLLLWAGAMIAFLCFQQRNGPRLLMLVIWSCSFWMLCGCYNKWANVTGLYGIVVTITASAVIGLGLGIAHMWIRRVFDLCNNRPLHDL